ncbi:MAG: hypothetical protein LUE98_14040, partial [Tannerellaceae bacterium]|nr:hypothetical protein [Tannerellaceae bacterium]
LRKSFKQKSIGTMKLIDTHLTIQDLKNIYHSDIYQKMLKDFNTHSAYKLSQEENSDNSFNNIQRRYLILNVSFDEVRSNLQKWHKRIVRYAILTTAFFSKKPDDLPDGEFPEGEESGEENKSEVIEELGVSRTWLLDKFCEFYLLETGDKDRLLDFLKTSRMPGAKKYQRDITKLYNQIKES